MIRRFAGLSTKRRDVNKSAHLTTLGFAHYGARAFDVGVLEGDLRRRLFDDSRDVENEVAPFRAARELRRLVDAGRPRFYPRSPLSRVFRRVSTQKAYGVPALHQLRHCGVTDN